MKKKRDKWLKWKIGSGSAAAIMLFFGMVQNSDAFQEAVQAKSGVTPEEAYTADGSGGNGGYAERFESQFSRSQTYGYGRGGGASRGSAEDGSSRSSGSSGSSGSAGSSENGNSGGSLSQRDSSGGMQSRTGRS